MRHLATRLPLQARTTTPLGVTVRGRGTVDELRARFLAPAVPDTQDVPHDDSTPSLRRRFARKRRPTEGENAAFEEATRNSEVPIVCTVSAGARKRQRFKF